MSGAQLKWALMRDAVISSTTTVFKDAKLDLADISFVNSRGNPVEMPSQVDFGPCSKQDGDPAAGCKDYDEEVKTYLVQLAYSDEYAARGVTRRALSSGEKIQEELTDALWKELVGNGEVSERPEPFPRYDVCRGLRFLPARDKNELKAFGAPTHPRPK